MLQFRRVLELFLLLQLQNHLWYRMVYIVIFKRLVGIPYVALLVRPMVPSAAQVEPRSELPLNV